MIRSFYYLPGEGVQVIDGVADFDRLSGAEGALLWVDMCKPSDQESFVLTHDFKFHPLAIEDVISEKPRTKIDDYDRYLRTCVKAFDAEEKTKSGIIVPDSAKEKPQEGKVIATGTGRLLDDGAVKPLEVRNGDRVLYGKYSGTEISLEGQDYLILREEDVLAIVQ